MRIRQKNKNIKTSSLKADSIESESQNMRMFILAPALDSNHRKCVDPYEEPERVASFADCID